MTDKAPTTAAATPLSPLPPGWTQNTAPSGHTYYYNTHTKESTYRRPAPPPPLLPPPPPPPTSIPNPTTRSRIVSAHQPILHHQPSYGAQLAPPPSLRLSDPRVANAFMAQKNAAHVAQKGSDHGHAGHPPNNHPQYRSRPQPRDRPRSRILIPGCEPWVLVYTKYGRRFVYNVEKNTSYWRIPEKLMSAIIELDKAGVQQKALAQHGGTSAVEKQTRNVGKTPAVPPAIHVAGMSGDEDDSEYEEVEVTDDDASASAGGDIDEEGGRRKRQRTEDDPDNTYEQDSLDSNGGPIEFSEADIAFQLQQAAGEMGDAYYDEGSDIDEGDYGEIKENGGAKEDGAVLFRALLDDFSINPFSSWEKLMEEGKLFDDPRYTALPSTKARKSVWEDWSRDAIRAKKAQKKAQEAANRNKDPRTAYLQLLQKHATPKLYWPEFKRKFRKEPAMKAAQPSERDKEKLYREYVARRKLPPATQKSDLTKLLESLPRSAIHNQTDLANLPSEVIVDLRYAAMEPQLRDSLVEAYLATAGPSA